MKLRNFFNLWPEREHLVVTYKNRRIVNAETGRYVSRYFFLTHVLRGGTLEVKDNNEVKNADFEIYKDICLYVIGNGYTSTKDLSKVIRKLL